MVANVVAKPKARKLGEQHLTQEQEAALQGLRKYQHMIEKRTEYANDRFGQSWEGALFFDSNWRYSLDKADLEEVASHLAKFGVDSPAKKTAEGSTYFEFHGRDECRYLKLIRDKNNRMSASQRAEIPARGLNW